MKKFFKTFGLFLLFQIIYVPILAILLVYYGPFTHTRDMIVTTSMTTMTHQYFATWFLDDDTINEILKANRPDEDIEDQALEDIEINTDSTDEGVEYIDVSTDTFKGYLLKINDPSRVKLVSAPKLGEVGSTTSQIVEYYDAIGGINASGFADDALGTGGVLAGLMIEDGVLTYGSEYESYSAVGLTEDNVLVVSNSMTYSQMKALNFRCAASFGPVIIINGKPTITSGDGGYGIQPRTAIGQTKDGAILMLVIDGRQTSSLGGTMRNVQDILLNYGAYNAFNLDGGASSTMVYNGKVINSPSDILGERYVPNAFIITKAKTDE
jgi:exopolysaccharide biosynthesis protein